MPGLVALRHNPVIMAMAQRLRQKGLALKAIFGVSMRRLVHLIYGVLTSGKPFYVKIPLERIAVQDGICPLATLARFSAYHQHAPRAPAGGSHSTDVSVRTWSSLPGRRYSRRVSRRPGMLRYGSMRNDVTMVAPAWRELG